MSWLISYSSLTPSLVCSAVRSQGQVARILSLPSGQFSGARCSQKIEQAQSTKSSPTRRRVIEGNKGAFP